MKAKFIKFIKENNLFEKSDKILVAISGGADSVVLADLLFENGFDFGLAHCNFKLRGDESDKDEIFCNDLAKKYNTKIFTTSFQTAEFAAQNKQSIELAARNLRYKWFEKIKTENNYKYIATAHHLNDNIETFFLKIIAGTGIRGFAGIKMKNKNIVRPLLFAKKSEIENYCSENKIDFRTDNSNFDNKYTRNKLRINILPLFLEINPNFENAFAKNFEIISDIQKIYNKSVKKYYKKCVEIEGKYTKINIKKLQNSKTPKAYLYEFIRKFGYNYSDVSDIFNSLNNQSGKIFYSKNFSLLKDRDYIFIKENEESKNMFIEILYFKNSNNLKGFNFEIIENPETNILPENNKTAFFDAEKIEFPIIIRNTVNGDFFYPLGMKNKKNLSDFFTDLKLNIFEKQDSLVMESNEKIFWIVDKRIDDRFKITQKTNRILKITHL